MARSSVKPLSDAGLNRIETTECIMTQLGCEAMLRACLRAGQHYWTIAAARMIADNIGLDRRAVRAGVGA